MKNTFLKLPQEKQDRILDAFMLEFVHNDFEAASLSKVVDALGIAKGSVYQYFGSKLEVYQSLQKICQAEKLKYVFGISREDFEDIWDWYRQLFAAGIKFDLERPRHSQFLYRSAMDRTNPVLSQMQAQIFKTSADMFAGIIAEEQSCGRIGMQFPPEFIALTVISQSLALRSYLETTLAIDLGQHIQSTNTVFAHEAAHIFAFVDHSIQMFRLAFSTPTRI